MNTLHVIVKATFEDLEDISQQCVDQALETEGRHVLKKEMQTSMIIVLQNERLGAYFKNETQTQGVRSNSGSFFVTYEWNIYQENCDWWLQAVYVVPAQRRQGVFRRMFQEIEKKASQQDGSVKLYVKVGNDPAIEVYEKMGMTRYKDISYQDDIYFNPFKGNLNLDPNFSTELVGINQSEEITAFLDRSSSLFNKQFKLTTRTKSEQIKFILQKTQNEGCILMTKQNGVNTMMTSYITEFCDWRLGLTLWVYDFRILDGVRGDQNSLKLMIENVLHHLKNLTVKVTIGCIRFMFDQEQCPVLKEIMESIGLPQYHYYIYGKENSKLSDQLQI